jgi:ATP-dependent DNA ligase
MSRNEALHSGRHNERVQLYAFDMLAGDGEDHRQLPLSLRKTNLARLLRRIPAYSSLSTSRAKSPATYSASPCREGIVSKRRDRAYTPGKCRHWVKTKNPAHPAYSRVRDQLLVTRSRNLSPSPKRKVSGGGGECGGWSGIGGRGVGGTRAIPVGSSMLID